jgi:hypothetical protein
MIPIRGASYFWRTVLVSNPCLPQMKAFNHCRLRWMQIELAPSSHLVRQFAPGPHFAGVVCID